MGGLLGCLLGLIEVSIGLVMLKLYKDKLEKWAGAFIILSGVFLASLTLLGVAKVSMGILMALFLLCSVGWLGYIGYLIYKGNLEKFNLDIFVIFEGIFLCVVNILYVEYVNLSFLF